MPTVLRIQGYRVGFFSADWDEPAHVHVTKSGNTAKVWVNPVQLAFNAGYRRDELMKSSASSKKTSKDSWKPGMNTLDEIRVLRVSSTADTLIIDFEDGRTVHLP